MDDDWDLQAVVRSCSASATTSSSIAQSTPQPPLLPPPAPTLATSYSDASSLQSFSSNFQPQLLQDNNLICFQDLFEQTEDKEIEIEELYDICKPFFFQTSKPQPISPQNVHVSPPSVLPYFQDLSSHLQLPPQSQQLLIQRHLHQATQQTSSINVSRKRESSNNSQNPRSKKRKNQMKKVCQIPAEGLSADMWSWRKYGQKPIKGSQYPRGYYKCSTSKGCLARKQVERDRSNPNMLTVTYTGEHSHPMPTHRNSLAGSTRQKPGTNSDDPNKPATPSVDSPTETHSPATERLGEEEDEDDFDISNIPLDDDFFAGLDDELINLSPLSPRPAQNDCFQAITTSLGK